MYEKYKYKEGKSVLLPLFIVVLAIIAVGVYIAWNNDSDIEDMLDTEMDIKSLFHRQADLFDVTGGAAIRGTTTGGDATGKVYTRQDGINYKLVAEFVNLPEPQGNDFYEGWIVKTNVQEVVSTGALELSDGAYVNTFSEDRDYSDFNLYVLTLEPDDGDPAPAEHILEGSLTLNDAEREKEIPAESTEEDTIDTTDDSTSATSTEILE